MKKIMFDDRFGLTKAVLDGIKPMTRRIAYGGEIKDIHTGYITEGVAAGSLALCDGCMIVAKSKYKLGEVVAVAQSYKDLGYTKEWVEQHISPNPNAKPTDPFEKKYPGWNNKMFVPAELNKAHQIRITDIKAEKLQDISDMDSRKEGVIPVTWRQYLKQDWGDLSPQKYIDHNVWTLPIFKEGILDPWAESHPDEFMADRPSTAFNVLIRKMMGMKKWESNPYVFAYSFKLIK